MNYLFSHRGKTKLTYQVACFYYSDIEGEWSTRYQTLCYFSNSYSPTKTLSGGVMSVCLLYLEKRERVR